MKRKTLISSAVMALTLSMGAGISFAAGPSSSAGGGSAAGAPTAPAAQMGTGTRNTQVSKDDKLARADRKFIEEAAGAGRFEAQAAQLAATKAQDENVKKYASMLVDHHNKANSELMQIANAKGVELPAAPARAHRNKLDDLGKKQGADFDREFVREIGVKAHEKDIKDFEKAAKDAKDPQVKAFAEKTLPVLREHLAAAQKLPQAGRDRSDEARRQDTPRTGSTGDAARMGSGAAPARGDTAPASGGAPASGPGGANR